MPNSTISIDLVVDILSNDTVTQRYKRDFEEAVAGLEALEAQKEELETAIAKQKKRVAALHELVQTDDDGPMLSGLVDGITDACRVVLRAANKPLLPIEIRDKVQELGLPPQSNLLASIYTTLRRMRGAGEIREVFEPMQPGGSAVAAYEWAGQTIANIFRQRMMDTEFLQGSESHPPRNLGQRPPSEAKLGVNQLTHKKK